MPSIVLERPEHAALIGAIAAEWTQVENALARLLAGAYGRTLFNDKGPYSVEHHPVALAAMEAAESIRARLRILDLTLGSLVEGTSVSDGWESLKKALRARGQERNRIVHGSWGISPEEPNHLIMNHNQKYVRYTKRELEDVLGRIVETRWATVNLTTAVMHAVHNGEIAQGAMGPQTGKLPSFDRPV